ncbi:hypothetical protein DPMN_119121 [Dreissena polymorpha]|uniref:Uncharacterized protein n=1 Tax=Dreissena polymorpha TaxID=45954 RepID=A0A9D4JRP8_DREPO|nr:hypothetical protein DPMN_119121 [Dreissena polymorpha]
MLEPVQQFEKDMYALRIATTLVNVNQSPTCSIMILNTFATEVTLRQDTDIGRAKRIERIVSVLATEECIEDKWNHAAIRRVKNKSRVCKVGSYQKHANGLHYIYLLFIGI